MNMPSIALIYRDQERACMDMLAIKLSERGLPWETYSYAQLSAEEDQALTEKLNEHCLALLLMTSNPYSASYKESFFTQVKDIVYKVSIPAFPLWILFEKADEDRRPILPESNVNGFFEIIFPRVVMDALDEFALAVERFVQHYTSNPFKGPEPYKRSDPLKGRDQDVLTLVECIRNNSLTLLYSQSGYGKSSLLQAGLIPALERTRLYFPVYISMRSINVLTVPVLRSHVNKSISNLSESGAISVEFGASSQYAEFPLEYLYNLDITAVFDQKSGTKFKLCPVLIFDQFEELFTRRDINAGKFFDELSYILEGKLPPKVMKALRSPEGNPSEKERYYNWVEKIASREIAYRVLFAFRQEYMINFEQFRNKIPSLVYTAGKFRLESFSKAEARKIITEIAGESIDKEEIAQIAQVLDEVCKVDALPGDDSGRYISPFILSLICRELYHIIVGKNVLKSFLPQEQRILDEAKLKSLISNVKDNYYIKCFSGLSPYTRIFVEDKLVSNEGKRTLFPYEDVSSYYNRPSHHLTGKTPEEIAEINHRLREDLDLLINDPRIRYLNINSYLNTPNIEILHDQLAIPVRNSRIQRQEQEEKQRKQVIKEELQKNFELAWQKRRAKSQLQLLGIAALVLLVMVITFVKFESNVVAVIRQFTGNEEATSLTYIERSNGTYPAFLEAFNYYSNLKRQIFPYSEALANLGQRRLRDSVEKMVTDAFKKEPFYGLVDLSTIFRDARLSPATGLFFSLKGDTLFSKGFGSPPSYRLLKGYRDSIVQGSNSDFSTPLQSIDEGSPRVHAKTNLLVHGTRILAVVNNVIYVLDNAARQGLVSSTRLTLPQLHRPAAKQHPVLDIRAYSNQNNSYSYSTIFAYTQILEYMNDNCINTDSFTVALSLDERVALVRLSYLAQSSKNVYWLIDAKTGVHRAEPLTLPSNLGIMNIIMDSDWKGKIIYARKVIVDKPLIPSVVVIKSSEIWQYRYIGGICVDSLKLGTDNPAFSNWVFANRTIASTSTANTMDLTASQRWGMVKSKGQLEIYDLMSRRTKPAIILGPAAKKPLEIIIQNRDTAIIFDSLKIEWRRPGIRQQLSDVNIAGPLPKTYPAANKSIRIYSAIASNISGCFVLKWASGYASPLIGLLDLGSGRFYVCNHYYPSESGNFYLYPDKRLAYLPSPSGDIFPGPRMLYWIIRDSVSDKTTIKDVEAWVDIKSKCSDTAYQRFFLSSLGK